jgi:hypothetical protein
LGIKPLPCRKPGANRPAPPATGQQDTRAGIPRKGNAVEPFLQRIKNMIKKSELHVLYSKAEMAHLAIEISAKSLKNIPPAPRDHLLRVPQGTHGEIFRK